MYRYAAAAQTSSADVPDVMLKLQTFMVGLECTACGVQHAVDP